MKCYFFIVVILFSSNLLSGQIVYQNDLVKLKMQTPANWKYAGTEESKKNLKEIKFTEEQLKRIENSNKGLISQISYYKYNIDSVKGFIPTVKITVRLNPANNFDEFKSMMVASANRVKSTLTSFEYLDNFTTVKLSNHNSIYYSCRYSITPVSSDKFIVRAKSYNIPRGRYFVSITFMDTESSEDCSNLFNELLKTISITD
jgi:hypothetical protein